MIGVFDSGNGGLTILGALLQHLPGQGFIYLGDHANAPYGCRPSGEVHRRTLGNVEWLFGQGCRLVLLACNTASAVALRRLQQDWLPLAHPDRRVLGVLVPMVEAVTGLPWQSEAPPATPATPPAATIGIFGTRRTVESGAYPFEIGRRAPAIRVVQQACPELAGAIEGNAPDGMIRALVRGYVAALRGTLAGAAPDAVVLGCTHYELVAAAFADALSPGVRLYRQPELVADSLIAYLGRHPDYAGAADEAGRAAFFTTGDTAIVDARASRFFGREVRFRQAVTEPRYAQAV